jgi:phosphomevalonate kinase
MATKTKQIKKTKTVTKVKSNRQVLTEAIKNLGDVDLVFVREALLTITKQVLDTREQVIRDMENSFISPHLYIECSENIYNSVKFEDEQETNS